MPQKEHTKYQIILIVLGFVVILFFNISETHAQQPKLKINYLLLTPDCSYDTNGLEFASLVEVAWYYMKPWVLVTKASGFCMTQKQFADFDLFEYKFNTIRVYMIDQKYWGSEIFKIFGYEPPTDITKTGGIIFFDDRVILMSFSLRDDLNAPILTHELLHYALWRNGSAKVAYIDDVHRDWQEYLKNSKNRERIYSNISNQYYFVFG